MGLLEMTPGSGVTALTPPGGASSVPAQIKAAVTDALKLSALK